VQTDTKTRATLHSPEIEFFYIGRQAIVANLLPPGSSCFAFTFKFAITCSQCFGSGSAEHTFSKIRHLFIRR